MQRLSRVALRCNVRRMRASCGRFIGAVGGSSSNLCSSNNGTTEATAFASHGAQRRWATDARNPAGANGANAATSGREPRLGVVPITSKNITTEMDTKVPLFLYFMVTNHPDVRAYTELVVHQVDQANRRLKNDDFGSKYQEFGKDAGLAVKLGMVDCLAEPGLMTKFNIDPHMFPIMYFVRHKVFCDKLVGVVTESHVKEAVEAFIDYSTTESKNEAEGKSIFQKIKRQDGDDENAMTLVSKAHATMQSNEIHKAKELYAKALKLSMEDLEIVNKRYGVGSKKLTPELWAALKREPCYNTAPEALCGLAMCAMSLKDMPESLRLVRQVRTEFPLAVKDMRSVAEAVVRIEMMDLVKFDVEKDNYMSLLKFDELTNDPLQFYTQHLKRAVGFYVENLPGQAIEECIRLIRAEPKLLPVLKEGGVVPKNLQLHPKAATPARQVVRMIFEALGPTSEHVEKGRRALQPYL